ncbi:MAG: glycosyltransferase family 39 protein [Saprospiraceae bacterium]|nr:glycosyltransferase family 39 protein [Saprospiraceae bacterium]
MQFIKKHLILILCLFNVVLHLLSIQYLEFHRDELLYFSLSNHLALGYASVPPFISWVALISKSIFGFSMFSVKIIPALLSGVFVYLGARIAKELGGSYYAQVLTIIALMFTPLGLRAFILFQPVPFDVVFWTLIYYLVLKYMNSEHNKWLYLLGITIGFALLNKYLILLQLFSLLLIIPFTRFKTVFKKKTFYFSLFIAFLICSPNIYWQITNDTPLFTHLTSLQETQLQYVDKTTFLIEQLFLYFTSIIIAAIGAFFLFKHSKSKQLWLFPVSALIVILSLLFLGGKAYYTAGVYPFLIAAGSVYIAKRVHQKWIRISIISGLIALILPIFPYGIPFLPPPKLASYFDTLENIGIDVGRVHEDGNKHPLPQDFADMTGWYTIAELAKEAYDQIEDKEATAIFGENYGIAGAVDLINSHYNMPECISFSDTYAYWVPQSFSPDVTSLIYINDELGSNVEELFENIRIIGVVSDSYSRQYGVTVYLCQNPKRSFNSFWSETLQRVYEDQ